MASYLNLCTACKTDFSSVSAFDRHRVGVHEYLYAEGLDMEPPREDGRRCLDPDEYAEAGLTLDKRGRWSLTTDADRERLARMAARA